MRLKILIRKITIPILQRTRQLHGNNHGDNLLFGGKGLFEEMADFDYIADKTAELDFVVEMTADWAAAAD